ncbi:hypothetical protein BANRA_05275 [Klebsiella pneumoniae]|nr:hypothetical protein BANRA_05275 [Klebsiella pneumoniae]
MEKKSLDIPPLIYPNGIVKNILRHFSQLLNVPITRPFSWILRPFKDRKENKHKFYPAFIHILAA